MPTSTFPKEIALTASGGTVNLADDANYTEYYVTGSATLAASWTIQASGTPFEGQRYKIRYGAAIALSGNTITIFGTALTQAQANSDLIIDAIYLNGGWWTNIMQDISVSTTTYDGYLETTLVDAGGTITLVAGKDKKVQRLIGSATLLGNWVVTAAAGAKDGDEFEVQYRGSHDLNGSNITIFGYPITQEEATLGGLTVRAVYSSTAGAWKTSVIREADTLPKTWEGADAYTILAAGGTVTLTPGKSRNYLYLTGSPTMAGNFSVVSGGVPQDGDEFWLNYSATATLGGFTMDLLGYSMSAIEALGGKTVIYAKYDGTATAWRVVALTKSANGLPGSYETLVIPVSFETGEIGDTKVKVGYAGLVTNIYAFAMTDIDDTDSGTITADINAVAISGGVITFAPTSSRGDTQEVSPTVFNVLGVDSILNLKTAKVTPGGKVLVSVKIQRT